MKILPTGNKVLLAPIPNPSVTPSGIHVVETGEIRFFHVLAVGPKVQEVKVGNRVVAPLYTDHHTFENGCKITDAGQIQLVVEG